MGYLERQYDDILAEESRIKRNPRFRDNRVHALLYFISPTGHAYVHQKQLVVAQSSFLIQAEGDRHRAYASPLASCQCDPRHWQGRFADAE